MRVRFITQPFDDGFDLRDLLVSLLRDPSITHLDVVVAWAKRSGLRIVEEDIQAFRARGGHLRMIVGISAGGATRQGLEMALSLATEAYVFNDTSGRTFHPKIYAAYGSDAASVLVGSHNLTQGGAVENFEAGILCELDLTNTEDKRYLDSIVGGYIKRLLDDAEICRRLDVPTLTEITSNIVYGVGNEDAPRIPWTSGIGGDGDSEDGELGKVSIASDQIQPGIFGRSKYKLRSLPAAPRLRPPSSETDIGRLIGQPPGSTVRELSVSSARGKVEKRWYKKMSKSDAQRPDPGTAPTGHLSLTQNEFPIDHRTFFRRQFFSGQPWQKVGAARERASVPILVVIHGQSFGALTLDVDHNPAFEAGQGNRTTTLRWGETLNEHFRQNDLVDDFVTLEQYSDGTYKLIIDENPTGPFKG